jgi:hypothetical protein
MRGDVKVIMSRYHCDRCGTDYDDGEAVFIGHASHKWDRCLDIQLTRVTAERDAARGAVREALIHAEAMVQKLTALCQDATGAMTK